MCALSTEWAPGYYQPGARPFELGPPELSLIGVDFAEEQLAFMERAARFRPGWFDKMYALTILALPDPRHPQAEALMIKATTLDEYGTSDTVVVPSVIEVDCSEWETFDEGQPVWRRFPSVLGRSHIYSPTTGLLVDGLAPHRLWNLWPLEDETEAYMVMQATKGWLESEWKPWIDWLEVYDNLDTSACEHVGMPEKYHRHQYDDMGYLAHCEDGEAWFEHYKNTQVTFQTGDPLPLPFPGVGGLHHLTETWQRLLGSSRASTAAAMHSFPHWERDDVARTERHYSPWLLSY